MGLSQEQEEARAKVAAVLGEPTLGPWCDEDDIPANWALSEWVVVSAWTDLGTGESRIVRVGSPDLLEHHRRGLLHVALDSDWEEA